MAPTRRARLKSYYKHLLITASDYLMWKEAAAKLDELNGAQLAPVASPLNCPAY